MFRKLVRKWTIRQHREMWYWIANKTYEEKRKVIKREYINTLPKWKQQLVQNYSNCFLCRYTIRYAQGNCTLCPLNWKEKSDNDYDKCVMFGGLYSKWFQEEDWEKAMDYAIDIANLEEEIVKKEKKK